MSSVKLGPSVASPAARDMSKILVCFREWVERVAWRGGRDGDPKAEGSAKVGS